ncbi:DUF2237 family protein [Salinibius halmophilus]|uniref:DUF2237 family protein n=1 Tax=Salinibius halmophilus TaxID=1853216 RepID=UPI000E6723EB|nr:DUF2237 domain-containing protein [Salinibius halmophilus]
MALNVLGEPLAVCSFSPLTGFFRDGCCNTGQPDIGQHTVCAQVTEAFLTYSFANGNDLVTPRPEMGFAGLRPGDYWCLCALRWLQAHDAGVAPPVKLAATNATVLEHISLSVLEQYAIESTN